MKTTAESLEWAYELDPKVAGQVAHYVDRLKKRNAELEAMLRAAGYSDEQIKAGTPYIELMGG